MRELQSLKEDMPTYPYLPAHEHGTFQRVLNLLPSEARSMPTHARNPYLLFLEVERVQSEAGALQAVAGDSSPARLVEAQARKGRARRIKGAISSKGGAAKAAVRKSAARAVGGVRELQEKRSQRKDMREAQENDPFSVTETPVEHTARMQHQQRDTPTQDGRVSPRSHKADWLEKQTRILQESLHSENPNWGLVAFMVKADDDVRRALRREDA